MTRTLLYIGPKNEFETSLVQLALSEGWSIDSVPGAEQEWLTNVKEKKPSIVIIDADIGDLKSLEICKTIRSLTMDIGIIFLAEKRDDINLIVALEVGADNYIYKPITARICLSYVSSLLRRASNFKKLSLEGGSRPTPSEPLHYGTLDINPETREVTIDKKKVDLLSSEFDLLYLLAANAGQVLSRQRIMEELRGTDYNGIDRSIDLRISRLRKHLKDDLDFPKRIKTVRGKGYLFNRYAWEGTSSPVPLSPNSPS